MISVLVDEDLPRSLVPRLARAGIGATDVRDAGFRGASDDEVLRYAVAEHLTLMTADVGFGNILRFPLGSHSGIVLARFPSDMPAPVVVSRLVSALTALTAEEVTGNLVIIEPGRTRLRRAR